MSPPGTNQGGSRGFWGVGARKTPNDSNKGAGFKSPFLTERSSSLARGAQDDLGHYSDTRGISVRGERAK